MPTDLIGPPRLRPGEGYAMAPGAWSLALRAALERRWRPLEPGGLRVRSFATPHGPVRARSSADPPAGAAPVVLVHGYVASSRCGLPAAIDLARDFAVLAPDLPGYGLTDPPATPLTVALLADALVGCAVAAGHARFPLVASSFGVQIAVEAALRHPDRIDRLVLIGPTVDPAARGAAAQAVRLLRNLPDEHPSVAPVLARDLVDMGPRRALALLAVVLADPIAAKLPRVHVPALVVRGGRDRVVPARWAAEVAEKLPAGRLAVLPGYAHLPQWSGALALAGLVRDFLRA